MKRTALILLLINLFVSSFSQELRSDISLSDPFIMADSKTRQYYMTGTGGGLWKSKDLELWTYLGFPFDFNEEAWMGGSPQVWASEIHHIDDIYYNISTLTNHSITIDSDGHPRRAVHIMSSKLADGKYTLISNGDATYLPAEKCTLDGTYFEDTDGKRYLLYCHEWIQNGNGTIEYIELKPDMSGTVGNGVVMTRAKNATWNTSPVTDGPFLFRTQTGKLGMIWTSWHGDRYVQGVAYSTSGKLAGPWKHESLPITPDNYGHGMLFRTFDGQLLMSIHSHRTIDASKQQWERHPTLFVMDDSGDQLRTVMEYKHNINAGNPTPVMVDNPEFEYGKLGWTCTTGAQNQLIAHNQNGDITGNFFESWDANSFTGEIYQEKVVPNGTYMLSAAAFRSQLITGGQQDAEAVYVFANGEQCLVDGTTPKTYNIVAHVTDGRIRFGIRSVKRNFRWMGIDNVVLRYYGTELLTAEELESAEEQSSFYLRNMRDGKYLNAGQSWGTQAILSNHPLDFRFVSLPDGKYAIDSRLQNSYIDHYAGTNGYLDSSLAAFTVEWTDSRTIRFTTNGTQYWGSTGTTLVNTTLSKSLKGAQWEVLTRNDLLNSLSDATTSSPIDATFLISCPNFGRNDTRVDQWTVSSNSKNVTLSSGNNSNNCAACNHSPFTLSQNLPDAPAGTYVLTAQGFYRQDGSNQEEAPVFFLGSSTTPLSVIQRNESSTSDASVSFTSHRYTSDPIAYYHDGNTPLQLGVRGTASSQWVVWDNFELQYLGRENTVGIHKMIEDKVEDESVVYDLSGRKVKNTHLRSGIYIKGNKKVFVNE